METPKDQMWFLSAQYILETIKEEQEETEEIIKYFFRGGENANITTYF
tara:strand:- start:1018 stop:1161 length:144 start_codon:yes stop_codon:yes gene_type:complete